MQLDPDQKEVYDFLIKRYKKVNNQLLPGNCGWGKTFVGVNVALHMQTKEERMILVFCPNILMSMWSKSLEDLNIKTLMICTYDKLAGKKSGCKHNLLTRKKNIYRQSSYWLKQKVFIICDESQAIKNSKSARHIAFFALISKHPDCKVLHLTAAPIDKKDNWISLYRNMGLVNTSTLIYKNNYVDYGLGDVFEMAKQHDKKIITKLTEKYTIKKSNIPEILQYLWKHIFRSLLVIQVKDPIYKHPITGQVFENNLCNFFATLDKKGVQLVNEAMVDLGKADIIKDGQVNADKMKRNFGVVILSLMKLCHAKITTIVRLSKAKLKSRKVIICCPFIDDQLLLYKSLEKYNPLLLNGTVKISDRDDIVEKFNQPNNNYKVLIMTHDIGGEGISLHDLDGRFPRTMFLIPTYHFLKMFQCAGRVYRRRMMSDVDINMIYSNNNMVESILVNLLAKTEVANDVLIPGSGRVFPGSWKYIIENENENHNELRTKLDEEQQKYKL